MRPPREDTQPWYKQFWPWFLISLPLSVVIASIYTINLAIQSDDGLVSDDYYKEGLAIHKDADRTARAKALGIAGDLAYEADTGAVTLLLQGDLAEAPAGLTMKVTHPTVPNRDQTTMLTRADAARYVGRIEPLGIANWQIQVWPEDTAWRIDGRLTPPRDKGTRLD